MGCRRPAVAAAWRPRVPAREDPEPGRELMIAFAHWPRGWHNPRVLLRWRSMRRVLLVVVCVVLGFGAPLPAAAMTPDAPCPMSAEADPSGSVPDCCTGLAAMLDCAPGCSVGLGSIALAFGLAVAAPVSSAVIAPRTAPKLLLSRAGPPLLHPPR